jgi:hypothetical protein
VLNAIIGAPEREPTLKAAIRAEATALLELFRGN